MDAPRALESTQVRGDEGPGDAEQINIQKPAHRAIPTHDVGAGSDPLRPPYRRGRMAASHALVPEIRGLRISVRRDMPSSKPESECESYLFVARNGVDGSSPDTVFYQAADAELAESLCRLCQREYGDQLRFTHKPSSSFSPDEQVLMDETLDDLSIYDDPDPGIYDPQPTREMLMRAQYARRAQRWEEMLKCRRERTGSPTQAVPGPKATCHADSAGCSLAEDVLLRVCGVAADDPELTAQHADDLRLACSLIGPRYVVTGAQLELALSLLASVLGSFSRLNPTHLPLGYSGPTVKSGGWLDRDVLERAGKQIVGILWADCTAETVAFRVEHAASEAVRLGFMEEQRYDAWRPGMASGSGWRTAVMATPYGVMRAHGAAVSSAPREFNVRQPQPPTATVVVAPPASGASTSDEIPAVNADAPSRDEEAADTRQYRTRLFALRERRGLADDDFAAKGGANVRQTAARLADELDVWVEAIRDADADRNPAGGYWSVLGDDLRDMLGPAELASGVFEDDWTPLLTHLRMNRQAELANTLDRLAEAVIPQAQELARDLDAVAYLRNGGPRDALYEHYAREDLATHEACVAQGRQDVGRDVMRIVAMLRTLAENETNSATAATIVSKSKPRRAPQRGTRAANIEKLEKELEKHLLAARDHAHSLRDRDREPALLPRPTQKELARRTGLTQPDVSRCLKDPRAKVLKILWETAESLDEVMKYKRR